MRLQFLDNLLDPFLEVAAIAGAGQQGAHVEREDGGLGQHFGHVAGDDLAGEAFGDGGLAHARVADQQRIVLGAPAQDLDAALDLGAPPDQRINLALAGLVVEVDAVGLQRLAVRLGGAFLGLRRAAALAGPLDGAGLGSARLLGDAVGDEVDRVVAGHLLLLQEIGGVALALGEDGDQHVGAGDLVAARGLDVDDGALDHALESGGRLGVLAVIDHERFQLGVDIGAETLLELAQIDVAGPHDAGRLGVVGQGQQQVLQRGVFVLAFAGVTDSAVERFFEMTGKCRQSGAPQSFSIVHWSGCWWRRAVSIT